MRQIIPHMAALLLLGASPVVAEPLDLPVDNRIRILMYTPSDVYSVPTKYGYQTSIVFANNEQIATVSVGDRSTWQIIPSGNRIFIRPMDDGLATNMTVITNLREYNFDISSVEEDKSNNLYVVQFRYPESKPEEKYEALNDGEMPALSKQAISPAPTMARRAVSIPPLDTQRTQNMNEAYTYSGDDAIAPVRVYDDGKKTYITYADMPSPPPVPMVMTAPDTYVVANHTIEGNRIILHTVVSGFRLNSPAGAVTVYNEYSTPTTE